jgi:hypothetical protein
MRTPTPYTNKSARSLACSSAGSGKLYSNKHPTAQKRQKLTAFVLKTQTGLSQTISHGCHPAFDLHSNTPTAALKSP